MATPDPIKPVIDALATVFAVPTGTPGDPASYKTGTATVPNPGLVGAITTLMQALYSASSDMNDVGTAIKTALTDVAKVITAIADQVVTLSSVADVANAMGQLQQGLALAQTENEIGYINRTGEFVWKDRSTRAWRSISEDSWAI